MGRRGWASLTLYLVLYNPPLLLDGADSKRIYKQGEQFPQGSDKLPLPHMLVFSVYMGTMKYEYTELTLSSMRFNPQVHYVLIQVVEDAKSVEADGIKSLAAKIAVPNFEVKIQTMEEWRLRIKDRLGIDVPFDKTWFYKLCDYKPVLGYLFPEYSNRTVVGKPTEYFYKYWGYADLDVIWGSFQRYAAWFQGRFPFVISGWFGTTGAAAFYINEPWTQELFKLNDKFISLLADKDYHNLDEGGTQTDPKWVVEGGKHAISWVQKTYVSTHNLEINYGKVWQDHCFIDSGDSNDWAGPVSWSHGRLRVVKGNAVFPAGRELLFYHRPDTHLSLPENPHMRQQILHDMVEYGFLLPNWIPLLTRFVCSSVTRSSLDSFRPYSTDCFAKQNQHDLDAH